MHEADRPEVGGGPAGRRAGRMARPRAWRDLLSEIDPAAARRPATLHAGQMLAARGHRAEAAEAYRAFLDREPEHVVALTALAALRERDGDVVEASACRARAHAVEVRRLGLDPAAAEEAVAFLDSAGTESAAPAAAPAGYVAAHFDAYADHFEQQLAGSLAYRGPAALRDAVRAHARATPRDLHVLDLGCGTGLVGPLVRPWARRLVGIDLSPGMLARARAKGVYDDLACAEIVSYLEASNERFDLVLAADVFVYLGDLTPVLRAVARVVAPGGRVAFTVEAGDRPGAWLHGGRRYAHHEDHLRAAAAASGLDVASIAPAVVRTQRLCPVASFVVLLSAPGAAAPGADP